MRQVSKIKRQANEKTGLSPAFKSSRSQYKFIYSPALLDAVTFLPVMLGRHVQKSPAMMMTVSNVGLKRDHPQQCHCPVGQKDPEDGTLMLVHCPNLRCCGVTPTLSQTLMIQDCLGQDSDNINENTLLVMSPCYIRNRIYLPSRFINILRRRKKTVGKNKKDMKKKKITILK